MTVNGADYRIRRIRKRIHRYSQEVVKKVPPPSKDEADPVDEVVNPHHLRPQNYKHGNSPAQPPECDQSSAHYGPKKEHGEYGRVSPQAPSLKRLLGHSLTMTVGCNSTFVYSVLFDGIEGWLSSFIAATFALPDPTLFDILDSPTPGTSLAAALTATAITAIVLAPLDLFRIT